jgi:hypothetical protein
MYDIFYILDEKNQKYLPILKERFPLIKTVSYSENKHEAYTSAKKRSLTKMFWLINLEVDQFIVEDFKFDFIVPEWDKQYIHSFKQGTNYSSVVCLIPKEYNITKKETEYGFFIKTKQVDINASITLPYDRFIISNKDDITEIQSKSTTSMFYIIKDNSVVDPNFRFDYEVFDWDRQYVHVFKQDAVYDGVYLIPKDYKFTKREIEYKFYMRTKQVDINASRYGFEYFYVSTYEDYITAQQKSNTAMFYAIKDDCVVDPNFKFDHEIPDWDKEYVHTFSYGISLIPKTYPITKKEAEYNFFMKNKEIDQVISRYGFEYFYVSTYEDYITAQQKSNTAMFYVIKDDCVVDPNFKFDHEIPDWDKEYVHTFSYGISLIPKTYPITKKEAEYNFFMKNKEIDQVISRYGFDIIFISYQEPNADENWEKLKNRFPWAKRIHGVKGIHQAHKAAAEISNTCMFWTVDGDAIIDDDFNFEYHVPVWDRKNVYVWKSQNPINDLVYGYGGVKLLPKQLVLDMGLDSVDMTTSIGDSFNSMPTVSNITSFNTDPFNTWKSAFRECVKLSSKTIDGQVDNETQERLDIWCSVGEDNLFGNYAIGGARYGREFGERFQNDKNMLSKINDWQWLNDEFNKHRVSIDTVE